MAISSIEQNDLAGIFIPKDACIVIVRTEWNREIVDILQDGVENVLRSCNVKSIVVNVPGAVEIGFAIKKYWDQDEKSKPDAFIALGCVLRGDTPHFDYVCQSVTQAVTQLNLLLPVPVIFGVLTVDNQSQADDRTGGKHGNKGEEAAATALKMISFSNLLKKES